MVAIETATQRATQCNAPAFTFIHSLTTSDVISYINMRIFTFIFALLLSGTVCARQISIAEAAKTAAAFLDAEVVSARHDTQLRAYGVNTAYHIFTDKTNDSFVILSGDTRMPQVLAYSHDNGIDLENIPPQLPGFLKRYSEIYDYVVDTGADISSGSSTRASSVLYTTPQWGQGEPFNSLCPTGCPTGCGATVMAMKMKYHNYPSRGKGFHSYIWSGQTLSMDFDFDLDLNIMDTDFKRGTYDAVQAEAVAKLMYACGVALDMEYAPEGSSSNTTGQSMMAKYFGYSNDIESLSREKIPYEKWRELLDNELDNVGPVLYRGDNDNGDGHIFLIDGRNSGGLYHINWGWNGSGNGYFQLGNFKLGDFDYSHNDWMIINAKPEDTGDFSPLILTARFGGNGLSYNRNKIETNDKFFVNISGLQNRDNESQSGSIALAITDKSGNIKQMLSSKSSFSLKPGYYYPSFTFPSTVADKDIEQGDRLAVFYKTEEDEEWRSVISGYGASPSVSAWSFSPEYADISWEISPNISIRSTSNQYDDKALKCSRFSFSINFDPTLVDPEVTINGETASINGDWYYIPFVDEDRYKIKITDKNNSGIGQTISDYNGKVDLYTLQGVRIASGISREQAIGLLKDYPEGMYLLRYGGSSEKIIR